MAFCSAALDVPAARPPVSSSTMRAQLRGGVVDQRSHGLRVPAEEHQLRLVAPDDVRQLVGDVRGVVLPGVFHPSLVAALRPTAAGNLVQDVVLALHLLLLDGAEHADHLDVGAGAVDPGEGIAGRIREAAHRGQQVRSRPETRLVAYWCPRQHQIEQYPVIACDDELADRPTLSGRAQHRLTGSPHQRLRGAEIEQFALLGIPPEFQLVGARLVQPTGVQRHRDQRTTTVDQGTQPVQLHVGTSRDRRSGRQVRALVTLVATGQKAGGIAGGAGTAVQPARESLGIPPGKLLQ